MPPGGISSQESQSGAENGAESSGSYRVSGRPGGRSIGTGSQKGSASAPAKTILLSLVYVFWHFGNFFLIEQSRGFAFFLSFLGMTLIYGMTVLTRWYRTIPLVVLSILIQNLGQLALWPAFKAINSYEVSHWTSLVYAGYHLIVALVMAMCAALLFMLFEQIGKLLKK